MRAQRLRATQKRRFRPRTTGSRHLCPIAPNHLAERVSPPTRPGEVWQADIPSVAMQEGWLHVAGVLDACSRRVVGWAADATMPTGLVARAFERAVRGGQPTGGLLHHSDRGSQYASDAYRELLRRHGAQASMSRAANGYDNAKMESFWATMKTELIGEQVFTTRAEAKTALFDCIEVFYNRQRLHGALGFPSPVDHENNLSENTKNHATRAVHENGARSPLDLRRPSFDGRTLQSSPASGGRAGYDGYKRKKGSKRCMGPWTPWANLLALLVTPANEHRSVPKAGELG